LPTNFPVLVTATFETDEHGDLFNAHVAALATAVDEHIISNHALVERIDELYKETVVEDLKR
jgi:hypothetical protein